jgi:hypothetical protein
MGGKATKPDVHDELTIEIESVAESISASSGRPELLTPVTAVPNVGPAVKDALTNARIQSKFARVLAERPLAEQIAIPSRVAAQMSLQATRPAVPEVLPKFGPIVQGLSVMLASVQERLQPIAAEVTKTMEVVRRASRAWAPQLEAAARAMQQFVETQRELDERTDAFVSRHGWPVPTSISHRAYGQIVSLHDAPKRDVNALMSDLFRPGTRAYHDVRSVLGESPHFASRQPLLRQVYRAQARGDWYLVVNGLLPLVEGVLIDATFPVGARPHSHRPGVERLTSFGKDFSPPIRAIEIALMSAGAGALFDPYDPPPGVEPRILNRNGVLHGVARRYGTAQNALKLFLLLVVMAEALEHYEVRRQRPERKDRRAITRGTSTGS